MAFAQLTWRESLRDIEACLAANQAKLFHMGLKAPPARSTLADALNLRDWRIYHALAQRLIARARALYAQEPSVLELDVSVYALDATTVDLCLSLFDWAPFRSTKAAIKLHTLLDLRGAIPAFIHISDGKLHDVNVLDILPVEAGAFYVMDRGYLDFERLHAMHQAGAFFVTRAKAGMDARRVYSGPTDRNSGVICDQRVMLNGFYSAKNYPDHLRRIRFKDPESGKTLVFLTNNTTLPALTIAALYKSRWSPVGNTTARFGVPRNGRAGTAFACWNADCSFTTNSELVPQHAYNAANACAVLMNVPCLQIVSHPQKSDGARERARRSHPHRRS